MTTTTAEDVRAYSMEQVAERLACSERHVRREIARGRLVARRTGSRVIVMHADLLAYVEALPRAGR